MAVRKMPSNKLKMSVDPKEQIAELQKLIGANKRRLAHTQKMLRDMRKRTDSDHAGAARLGRKAKE